MFGGEMLGIYAPPPAVDLKRTDLIDKHGS
jgi:hypothetical protein